MKKLLIYYSTYEITSDAKRSVPRLLASLISYLENRFEITFFTFNNHHSDKEIKTSPIHLGVKTRSRLFKKFNKIFLRKKNFGLSEVKRHLIDEYLATKKTDYSFILALRLGDLKKLKTKYPDCILLYWFHDLTIVQSGESMMLTNYADHVITPSITSYHRILKAIEPDSLTSEWHHIGNWIKEDFTLVDQKVSEALRKQHKITDQTKVLIFSGGDLKFKGGHIIQRALKKICSSTQHKVILFYAGETTDDKEFVDDKVRIIKIGNLSPEMLASYYAVSHIGLFPSLGYEHSPLTLLEMISAGVMPVASNSGGVWEILGKDYEFLIDFPNSVDAWTTAIEKTISLAEDARTNIVVRLRDNLCKNYNGKTNKNKFLNLLTEAG